MDTDRGLARRLPPPPENKDQKDDDIIVKERNILQVRLNKDNQLMCGTGGCLKMRRPFFVFAKKSGKS